MIIVFVSDLSQSVILKFKAITITGAYIEFAFKIESCEVTHLSDISSHG